MYTAVFAMYTCLMKVLSAGETIPNASLATRFVQRVLLQPGFCVPDVGGHVLEHFTVPHNYDFHFRAARVRHHLILQ